MTDDSDVTYTRDYYNMENESICLLREKEFHALDNISEEEAEPTISLIPDPRETVMT